MWPLLYICIKPRWNKRKWKCIFFLLFFFFVEHKKIASCILWFARRPFSRRGHVILCHSLVGGFWTARPNVIGQFVNCSQTAVDSKVFPVAAAAIPVNRDVDWAAQATTRAGINSVICVTMKEMDVIFNLLLHYTATKLCCHKKLCWWVPSHR